MRMVKDLEFREFLKHSGVVQYSDQVGKPADTPNQRG